MRRIAILIVGLALLAGCAAAPSEPPPTPQSTHQSTAAAETPGPTTAPAADTTAEQKAVLDGFVSYGSDTAGGSLKNTQAAASLVEYLSYADIETATAMDWMAGLTDEQQAMLDLNWPGILAQAQAISADPAAQKEQLESAGVMTDFAGMVLTGVPDKLVTLNTVLTGKAG